ncbi:hypothetical protein WDU94_011222 [Cyamophila willieti]
MVHSFIPSIQLLLTLILHAILVRTDQPGISGFRVGEPYRTDQTGASSFRTVQSFRTDQTGILGAGQSFRSDQTVGSGFPLRSVQPLRDSNRPVKVCGKQLANMLSVVCNGKYFHSGKRRSVSPDTISPSEDDEYSILHKRQILGDTEDQPRVNKKGIYDECCREQCKLSTLQEYCAD